MVQQLIIFAIFLIIINFLRHIMPDNTFRLMTWNVQGVMYGSPYLYSLLNEVDIAVLTEHWLMPEQLDFLDIIHPEFKSFSRADSRLTVTYEERLRHTGFGGIAILYRKSLCVNPLSSAGNDRVLGVEVKWNDKCKYFVFGALLPSTNFSVASYSETIEELKDQFDMFCQEGITILAGDFNGQLSSLFSSKTKCLNANARGAVLEKFLCERHLVSVNSQSICNGPEFTFFSSDGKSKSLIDHILLQKSKFDLVVKADIIDDHPLNISDHHPVKIELVRPYAHNTMRADQHIMKSVNWKKASPDQISRYKEAIRTDFLAQVHTAERETNVDIEIIIQSMINILHDAASKFLPIKRFCPYANPYWKLLNVKRFHTEMRRKRREWISNGRPRGWVYLSYANYKKAKKLFAKELLKAKETYDREQFSELEKASELDISTFYKFLRKKRYKHECTFEIESNGIIVRDLDSIRELWANHFSKLSLPDNTYLYDENHCQMVLAEVRKYNKETYSHFDKIIDKTPTREEISSSIRSLNKDKACGPDGIFAEHLLFADPPSSVRLLEIVFAKVYETEKYPRHFKQGIVLPLFKGGRKNKLDMNNYRDITIIPVFQKVLEKIIYNRLVIFSEQISFPNPLQQGFRNNCGSITAAFCIKEAICYYMDRDTSVYVTFLDNAKAFNTVWHSGLFYKLYRLGIQGKTWRIMKDSFENVTCSVLFAGKQSERFGIKQGVGQGRTLSAWLFLVMIDDLITELDQTLCGLKIADLHLPCVLLADDTTVMANSHHSMQHLLDNISSYARRWRLRYNADKSCTVLFTNKRTAVIPSFLFDKTQIPAVKNKKYAGVPLAYNLKSNYAIEEACDKGKHLLNSFYFIGIRDGGMNPLTSLKIWKRIILPSVLYGCELWSGIPHSMIEKLELCQRYAARRMQALDKYSPREATCSSLGLWPMEAYVAKSKLSFFNRLCGGEWSYIWKKIFTIRLCQYLTNPLNQTGFIPDIDRITKKYSMGNVLLDYAVKVQPEDKRVWNRHISCVIQSQEETSWRANMELRNDLIHFRNIHLDLKPSNIWFLGRKFPSMLWPLSEIVKLSVMPVVKSVICKLCGKEVDDRAKHLIVGCEMLFEERNVYFERVIDTLEVRDGIDLFNQEDDILLETLLGSRVDCLTSINDDVWNRLMLVTAGGIASLYKKMNAILTPNVS